MGPPQESTRHELWQAEPVDTSVLQEGDHPQARRVSETGLPVRAPGVRLVGRWEARCEEQPAEQAIQMACIASTRAWHDNSSRNTCWPTPLVHTSAPRGGKDAWILICACAHEKETRQCYCWGGGEDILCHVCFLFLLQNETTETLKKNS